MKSVIVEVGFDIGGMTMEGLEKQLASLGIPYYIEPPSRINYTSLEDLECICEGK